MMTTEIPKSEFQDRIVRVQAELANHGLDALLTFGNEAEPAFVRYLCDYWPAFETAGVLVPAEGDPLLLIGPESLAYAQSRSKIDQIRQILEYREAAEPEYPGKVLDTFASVFDEVSGGRGIKRLGIVGYPVTPVPVYEGIRAAMTGGEIVRADDILINIRMVKSENELALLRQASRISEGAMEAVLNNIKPGMAEVQVVGIAQEALYRLGAEYEGHPLYVLSGRNSANAIGRPTHKKLEEGEIIQLNIGARVGGYSSSVGRPIVLGRMSDEVRAFLQTGLDAANKTIEIMRAGVPARDVALTIQQFITDRGYGDCILYGPCHGLGLMECEHPWIETNSDYALEENFTFQVDSFLHTQDYGARWEDGVRVTRDGVEQLSSYRRELIVV
jgi:Xaa-Pro aminopeptidase